MRRCVAVARPAVSRRRPHSQTCCLSSWPSTDHYHLHHHYKDNNNNSYYHHLSNGVATAAAATATAVHSTSTLNAPVAVVNGEGGRHRQAQLQHQLQQRHQQPQPPTPQPLQFPEHEVLSTSNSALAPPSSSAKAAAEVDGSVQPGRGGAGGRGRGGLPLIAPQLPPSPSSGKYTVDEKLQLASLLGLSDLEDSMNRLLEVIDKSTSLFASSPDFAIPEVRYRQIEDGRFPQFVARQINRRGIVVVREAVPESTARRWRDGALEYLVQNAQWAAPPKIHPLFWSGIQQQCRSHPRIISMMDALNGLWADESPQLRTSKGRHMLNKAGQQGQIAYGYREHSHGGRGGGGSGGIGDSNSTVEGQQQHQHKGRKAWDMEDYLDLSRNLTYCDRLFVGRPCAYCDEEADRQQQQQHQHQHQAVSGDVSSSRFSGSKVAMSGHGGERWTHPLYQYYYRRIFQGQWEEHDPFDASPRAALANEEYDEKTLQHLLAGAGEGGGGGLVRGSGAAAGQPTDHPMMATTPLQQPLLEPFRPFHGFLSLAPHGESDNVQVIPMNRVAIAFAMLRPFLRDALEDDTAGMCGTTPGLGGLKLNEKWHQPLLNALVNLPPLSAGDAVMWHADLAHCRMPAPVNFPDRNYVGLFMSSMPLCRGNTMYLAGQRQSYELGSSPPSFPPTFVNHARKGGRKNGETRKVELHELQFKGRATVEELTNVEKQGLGLEAITKEKVSSGSNPKMLKAYNKALGFGPKH